MRDIFEKFPREDQNPGGGGTHPPPGRPKVDFYLGRPRVISVRSFVRSFVCLFVRSFVRSFVLSFVLLLLIIIIIKQLVTRHNVNFSLK